MSTFFSDIEPLPEDAIFGLQTEFNNDPRKDKINLSIGAYQNNEGHWEVFTAVRKAEQQILDQQLNKEYQSIEGHAAFIEETTKLIFGNTSERIFGAQTIGGTSALRIGGDFLSQCVTKLILLPNPTWINHSRIFTHAGMTLENYPYYDTQTHTLDFEGMCRKIQSVKNCAILLHGCCHNPSGIDPTHDQWKELSKLIKKQNLFPFFDLAYQGFGEGLERDAYAVRLFFEEGHEFFVAYSYSKNFGLYGERAGLFAAVTQNKRDAEKIGTHIKGIIRGNYSNPPLHSARIIATVLKNPSLKALWANQLTDIRNRIESMREKLYKGLKFDFLKHQKGMFSYSGLNEDHVARLKKDYGIYMLKSGRINITGLNDKNIERVLKAIQEVIKQ